MSCLSVSSRRDIFTSSFFPFSNNRLAYEELKVTDLVQEDENYKFTPSINRNSEALAEKYRSKIFRKDIRNDSEKRVIN